jgi:hypothetical protein
MTNEGSPVLKEIGAPNVTEAPWPEEQTVCSSSGGSSDSGSESAVDTQEERIEAMDPCESLWSYAFGPSTVTIGCIRTMASLHYFAEGDVPEAEEEVVPEPANDEVVVFRGVFNGRAPLASSAYPLKHSAHVLSAAPPANPNAFAQLVLSFSGVPTTDGFMKPYELHYQPKKVDSDQRCDVSIVWLREFSCKTLPGQWGKGYLGHQKQMGYRMDEGMVLL